MFRSVAMRIRSVAALGTLLALASAGCGRVSFGIDGGIDSGHQDASGDSSASDSASDASADSASDAGSQAPPVAFITSQTILPQDTDRAAADAFCNSRAAAAGLPGTFAAWYGIDNVNATVALENSGGWVRTDGMPIAINLSDLSSGKILYPISLDEFAIEQGRSAIRPATATDSDGEPNSRCGSNGQIRMGDADRTGSGALSTGNLEPCDQPARLYCFEVGRLVTVTPVPEPGRLVFLSTRLFTPTGGAGLAAADAICNMDATEAGRTETFVALLPTDSQGALSRITPAAVPWVRPDGMRVATATGFSNSQLETPINVTLALTYESGSVWAGVPTLAEPTAPGGACGAAWTTGGQSALTGRLHSRAGFFLQGGVSSTSCTTPLRVYCAEQR